MKFTRKQFFILLIGAILGLVTAVLIVLKVAGNFSSLNNTNNNDQPESVLGAGDEFLQPTPPEDLKELNVILLGYGGAGHQGGHLTDVIQVAHFDFEQKKVGLISIPRDLWVELPSGERDKINAAFSSDIKKASVIKSMASEVTGLPIKYFVGIDFVGFQRVIGYILKGIEVEVAETLDDPWYPIRGEELNTCGMSADEVAQATAQYSGFELEKQFACRYEHLHFEPGVINMEGGDALKYVRSRHGSGAGDFSRSRRQHEVLLAIKEKLFSLTAIRDTTEFFKTIIQHLSSDIDLEIAKYIAPALQASRDYKVCKVVLSTDNVFASGRSSTGQSILQPRTSWADVREYVQSELSKCN